MYLPLDTKLFGSAHTYIGLNYIGHSYTGHNYIGRSHSSHNYKGHNNAGHSYTGKCVLLDTASFGSTRNAFGSGAANGIPGAAQLYRP